MACRSACAARLAVRCDNVPRRIEHVDRVVAAPKQPVPTRGPNRFKLSLGVQHANIPTDNRRMSAASPTVRSSSVWALEAIVGFTNTLDVRRIQQNFRSVPGNASSLLGVGPGVRERARPRRLPRSGDRAARTGVFRGWSWRQADRRGHVLEREAGYPRCDWLASSSLVALAAFPLATRRGRPEARRTDPLSGAHCHNRPSACASCHNPATTRQK